MTAYDRVVDALRGVGMRVRESATSARSQCPAHRSRGYTLGLWPKPDQNTVGLTCFAGCSTEDVLAEIGLALTDLYDDDRAVRRDGPRRRISGYPPPPRPKPKPTPWDLLGDPEHFCDRALQQQALEATPEYQQHLRDLAEWAKPRPGDYLGGPARPERDLPGSARRTGDWGDS